MPVSANGFDIVLGFPSFQIIVYAIAFCL